MFVVGDRPSDALLEQRQEERKRKKVGISCEGALPIKGSDLVVQNPLLSKERKRSGSGKKRVNIPLVPEKPVAPNGEDPEALVVGEDEESLLVLEEMVTDHLEGCFMDFLTWSVSFKRRRSNRSKRIDYGEAVADLFWSKTTLEMTP